MKYCGKCGEPTDNIETKVCNNCLEPSVSDSFFRPGEALEPCPQETEDISKAFYTANTGEILPLYYQSYQEDEPPKKKSFFPVFIGIGVIAAIALTVGLIASGIFASPVDRFIAIQRNHVINPLLAAYEEDLEEEVAFSLSVTASAEASGINPGILAATIIEQIAVDLDFNFHADPTQQDLMAMTLHGAGVELLSAVFTFDEEYLGFTFPSINDSYYVLRLSDLQEMAGMGSGPSFTLEMTHEEAISFIERYSDLLLSIVNEDNLEVTRETVSLFDGREEVNAQVYTVTPTAEDYREFLLALVEEMKEDELMYQAFMMYLNTLLGATPINPAIQHLMRDEEITRELWEITLDTMVEDVDEIVETLVDSGLVWRVATHRRQLILQEFTFDSDELDGFFRYEGLLSGNQRTDWFRFEDNDGNIQISLKNQMTISRSTAVGDLYFAMTLSSAYLPDSNITANIFYDFDLTNFSNLELPHGFIDMELAMSHPVGETSIELSLLIEDGEEEGSHYTINIYNLDHLGLSRLTLYVQSFDEPPVIQAPTANPINLSDMSEMELLFLLLGLGGELQSVFDFFNLN